MSKLLSIVVPSYNTSQYIEECIPKMLVDGLLDELEIILIDDGSVDDTLPKLRRFERKYPNTVRVVTKENGGHGSTINYGIKIATGKYFKVIDGDDWVNTANLFRLLTDVRNEEVDLIINPYMRVYEGTQKHIPIMYNLPSGIYSFEELAPNLSEISIHAITYRTQLLQKNELHVREKCYYDDAEYVLYPLMYMEKVLILDYPVYNYRVGTVEQSINPQKVYKNRDMHKQIVLDCINFWNEEREFIIGNKKNYCKKFVIKKIMTQYSIYLKAPFGREHLIEFREWDAQLREKDKALYKLCDKSVVWVVRRGGIVAYLLVWLFFQVYQRSVHRGWN
ncbi:MAG: glycosyltransferase family 2 protein [Lachnospiraceae bacterium]|nr:glycosyltransferase family 2 protein [Lachnospiraceae bacterium]